MIEIVIPMLCPGCMNTKVQGLVLSGWDQHIAVCFGVCILTLDSECQQIFFLLGFLCVCTHSDFQAPFVFREGSFEYKNYRIMLVYLKTTSREEYVCQ